jgi:hypothetical protein
LRLPVYHHRAGAIRAATMRFLISRLFGGFLTIEFMFKRPNLGLNFLDHFYVRRR